MKLNIQVPNQGAEIIGLIANEYLCLKKSIK